MPHPPWPNAAKNKLCLVNGCTSIVGKHGSHGMCGLHAQRVKRYGDPAYITHESVRVVRLREAQLKSTTAKPTTYRKYFGKHQHRVIAEYILGRKLLRKEIVHHKDGNVHNNDPSNLEIMTQSRHINEHRQALIVGRKIKHGY